MNTRLSLCAAAGIVLLTLLAGTSSAQLFTETFDDANAATRWQANSLGPDGIDLGPPEGKTPIDSNFDTDGDGVTDDTSGFAFDYSTVGIPSAPNSSGGSTVGMKLQVNQFTDAFGGFSVSPLASAIPVGGFTGDYKLSYDIWQNYVGNLNINSDPPNGPADGQTHLAMAGILTSGTVPNSPGFDNVDSVFFSHSTDGDTSADYRVYSSDRAVSYQLPHSAPSDPDFCACDEDAIYHAGTRNQNGQLYMDNFGGPTVAAPAAQLALFPGQTGSPLPGVTGMAWHEGEIEKIGDTVTWKLDGVLLITLDISNFTVQTGGNNILFGESDSTQASSLDPLSETLLFTLIDNVVVSGASVAEDANFDGDLDVDSKDFLAWQLGFGIDDGTALPGDGDANDDGNVNDTDLGIWEGQYGTGVGPLASVGAVPEPASVLLLGIGAIGLWAGRRRR